MAAILALGFLPTSPVQAQSPNLGQVPAANPRLVPASPQSFSGSVPTGTATAEPLVLSLKDAIALGLKQNLGAVLSAHGVIGARGERWQDLANLLPNSHFEISENAAQVNAAATFGFRFPGFPAIIGPFGYFATGASLNQTFFNWSQINQARSGGANLEAAKYSYEDA
ncbi:MAG TPA: hypothetical protein VKG84_02785, partial [Candidatus Acidoferrales bacterium]|nr:hypothetical protein [Candidatus Acidoferrales bacterium]